jgi:hypothetical protein
MYIKLNINLAIIIQPINRIHKLKISLTFASHITITTIIPAAAATTTKTVHLFTTYTYVVRFIDSPTDISFFLFPFYIFSSLLVYF